MQNWNKFAQCIEEKLYVWARKFLVLIKSQSCHSIIFALLISENKIIEYYCFPNWEKYLISENYYDWSRPGKSVHLVLDPGICFVNLLLKTVWYKCAKRASFGWVLALLVINLQHNLIRWEIAKMFLTLRMFKKCSSGSRILGSQFFKVWVGLIYFICEDKI